MHATRNGSGCHHELAWETALASKWSRPLEWIAHAETVHALAQTEFVRTLLAPSVFAMLTGTAGIFGGIPLMWVMVGSSLGFMAVIQGLLRASELKERKTPLNKLRYNGTIFHFDLFPISDNRRSRRLNSSVSRKATLPSTVEPIVRELEIGQLGVELFNTADFPISLIVHSAETEIENCTPPRTQYPKPAITVLPGIPVRVVDERITLNRLKCGRLEGKMHLKIMYGLPGKEIYDLDINAKRVDVLLQENGFCAGTSTAWEETKI
jgi:hypothetical protein